jgi:hypothetical protein
MKPIHAPRTGGVHPGFNAMAGRVRDPIHINPKHKGELHAELGVPQGQKIPAGKLAKAENSSNPAERKRAQFAANAKKWGR